MIIWFHSFVLFLSYIGKVVISLKFSPTRGVITNRDYFFFRTFIGDVTILPVLSIIAWSCDWLID